MALVKKKWRLHGLYLTPDFVTVHQARSLERLHQGVFHYRETVEVQSEYSINSLSEAHNLLRSAACCEDPFEKEEQRKERRNQWKRWIKRIDKRYPFWVQHGRVDLHRSKLLPTIRGPFVIILGLEKNHLVDLSQLDITEQIDVLTSRNDYVAAVVKHFLENKNETD